MYVFKKTCFISPFSLLPKNLYCWYNFLHGKVGNPTVFWVCYLCHTINDKLEPHLKLHGHLLRVLWVHLCNENWIKPYLELVVEVELFGIFSEFGFKTSNSKSWKVESFICSSPVDSFSQFSRFTLVNLSVIRTGYTDQALNLGS